MTQTIADKTSNAPTDLDLLIGIHINRKNNLPFSIRVAERII
jgi:hypothetical protein